MKVYVVTTGSYSDYSIDSVWDSMEAARKYISDFEALHQKVESRYSGSDFNDVEEYEFNAASSQLFVEIILNEDRGFRWIHVTRFCHPDRWIEGTKFCPSAFSCYIREQPGEGKEYYVKVASERYSKFLAEKDLGLHQE